MPDNPETLAEYRLDSESGLPCVQYYSKCDDAQKKLIQAYCKMCKLLKKWAPLNLLFSNYFLDELLTTRGCEVTLTGLRLHNYGSNAFENTSDQILFDLQNEMDSYEVRFNLSEDMDFGRLPSDILRALRQRERRASAALEQLPHHYIKDAGDDAAKFQTQTPNSDAQRIRHSRAETFTEIEHCCSAFLRAFLLRLTRFACSPNTAPQIIQNSGGDISLFNDICGVGRGVYPFPNPWSSKMAISTACCPNLIYAVSKQSNPLLRLEGPKIITQDQSETCTVQDFYLYRCAHDVMHIGHPFGCVIDLVP